MLSIEPVDRSSSTKTSSPRASSASARCEPMKPAPPVMKTRMVEIESSWGRPAVARPARVHPRRTAGTRNTHDTPRRGAPALPAGSGFRQGRHDRGGALRRPRRRHHGVAVEEGRPARRERIPRRIVVEDPRQGAGQLRRSATPAMTPASTNGDRLFGSPTTSAGTPSAIASIATVEFTVTTTRATVGEQREIARRRGHAHVRRGRRRRAGTAPRSRPGAASRGARAGRRRPSRRPAPRTTARASRAWRRRARRARPGRRPRRAGSALDPAGRGGRPSSTNRSSRGLPVTRSASSGNVPAATRWSRGEAVEEQRAVGRGKPRSAGFTAEASISSGSCR